MADADTVAIPRVPKLGFKVEVKRERLPPPDPEDRRPWWRRLWDAIRGFMKVDLK